MFEDFIDYPIRSDKISWEAREVIRDIEGRPRWFECIQVAGTHFPHRALEPFVTVGDVRSVFALIAEDGLSVRAYFEKPLPNTGVVRFGYGEDVLLEAADRFDARGIRRLDRKRLPRGVQALRGD